MSGYYFFLEGQWHRTESKGCAARCACGASNHDPRATQWRTYDDDDDFAPVRRLAPCFAPDEINVLKEQNQKLRACIVYARDRRGGLFDYDEWIEQVEHALDNKIPPHAIEHAHSMKAQAWGVLMSLRKECYELRKNRDELLARLNDVTAERTSRQGKVIDELREKLRIAEAVRDDARAASQRYLDEKRELERKLGRG